MKKLFIPLLFMQLNTYAQTGFWLDAGVQKKWNKKFNLVLGYYYPTTETLLQYKRDKEYRRLKKKNNESN